MITKKEALEESARHLIEFRKEHKERTDELLHKRYIARITMDSKSINDYTAARKEYDKIIECIFLNYHMLMSSDEDREEVKRLADANE